MEQSIGREVHFFFVIYCLRNGRAAAARRRGQWNWHMACHEYLTPQGVVIDAFAEVRSQWNNVVKHTITVGN